MILSHVFFAPADVVGSANAIQIIQAGQKEKHNDKVYQLWCDCRKKNRQPKTITIEELADRGADQIVTKLCQFATAHPIQVYFDQELNLTTITNMCCVASTLTGYVEKKLRICAT